MDTYRRTAAQSRPLLNATAQNSSLDSVGSQRVKARAINSPKRKRLRISRFESTARFARPFVIRTNFRTRTFRWPPYPSLLVGEANEYHYSRVWMPTSGSFRSSAIANRSSHSSNRHSLLIPVSLSDTRKRSPRPTIRTRRSERKTGFSATTRRTLPIMRRCGRVGESTIREARSADRWNF
jgi:hypothetical protein